MFLCSRNQEPNDVLTASTAIADRSRGFAVSSCSLAVRNEEYVRLLVDYSNWRPIADPTGLRLSLPSEAPGTNTRLSPQVVALVDSQLLCLSLAKL